MTTRPASREPRHSVTLARNGRLAERPLRGEAVNQPELDLSDMDDFEVIEERRRVQTALAFLTSKYKALNDEISRRGTLRWMAPTGTQ